MDLKTIFWAGYGYAKYEAKQLSSFQEWAVEQPVNEIEKAKEELTKSLEKRKNDLLEQLDIIKLDFVKRKEFLFKYSHYKYGIQSFKGTKEEFENYMTDIGGNPTIISQE